MRDNCHFHNTQSVTVSLCTALLCWHEATSNMVPCFCPPVTQCLTTYVYLVLEYMVCLLKTLTQAGGHKIWPEFLCSWLFMLMVVAYCSHFVYFHLLCADSPLQCQGKDKQSRKTMFASCHNCKHQIPRGGNAHTSMLDAIFQLCSPNWTLTNIPLSLKNCFFFFNYYFIPSLGSFWWTVKLNTSRIPLLATATPPWMSPISSKSYPIEFYPSKNEVTLPFVILKQHFRYSKELQLAQTGEGCSVQREAGESRTDEGSGHWVRMEKNSWNTFGVPGTQGITLPCRRHCWLLRHPHLEQTAWEFGNAFPVVPAALCAGDSKHYS